MLAGLDADVLDGLWTADELSDLGQQWAGDLGKDDLVDKGDGAEQPVDRVDASGKVRCIIGDLEFGVLR